MKEKCTITIIIIITTSLFTVLHYSSKLIFKNPDKDDFGTFSVAVTNTSGISSSYSITAEGTVGQKSLPNCTSAPDSVMY